MRAFVTKDGRRYLTTNGANTVEDTEVPLRQDDYELMTEHFPGMDTKMTKEEMPVWGSKISFRASEVISIIVMVVMVVGLYFALRGELNVQNVQIQSIKEAQVANTHVIRMELEDLKKRLDTHEQRAWGNK